MRGVRAAVAFRGRKGSGKSATAKALASALRWPLVVTGDVVREWALKAEGMVDAASVLRAADGARVSETGVMGRVLQQIWPRGDGPPSLVVDSVREPADIVALEALGYRVVVVTVVASFETRLARVVDRGREDDRLTRDALRNHDRWEQQLGRMLAPMALELRVTSGSLETMVTRITKRLREEGLVHA